MKNLNINPSSSFHTRISKISFDKFFQKKNQKNCELNKYESGSRQSRGSPNNPLNFLKLAKRKMRNLNSQL